MLNCIMRGLRIVLPAMIVACAGFAWADGTGDPTAVKQNPDGGWVDKDGNPTFKIDKDGTVDWFTYIGFVRYSANCLQCHGPDGMGSTYAPPLVDSLKRLSYADFYATVASGKKDVSASQDLVMPSLGDNKNVMCFINQIFVYLRARSDGALDRGRPQKAVARPADFEKEVDECMG
jgi:methanol metabolism-related c-type cytochrome